MTVCPLNAYNYLMRGKYMPKQANMAIEKDNIYFQAILDSIIEVNMTLFQLYKYNKYSNIYVKKCQKISSKYIYLRGILGKVQLFIKNIKQKYPLFIIEKCSFVILNGISLQTSL